MHASITDVGRDRSGGCLIDSPSLEGGPIEFEAPIIGREDHHSEWRDERLQSMEQLDVISPHVPSRFAPVSIRSGRRIDDREIVAGNLRVLPQELHHFFPNAVMHIRGERIQP